MTYKRQIAYLDYMEFGEKKGSSGFCKWEQKKEIHTLEISINGLDSGVVGTVKIFTRIGNELGSMKVQNGRATAIFSKNDRDGNWEWEFSKIVVVLGEDRELVAEFPIEKKELAAAFPIEKKEMTVENSIEEDSIEREAEATQVVDQSVVQVIEAEPEALEVSELDMMLESEEPDTPQAAEEPQLHSLWDCLVKTHKIIYPFGTDAEYCRIMLEDIFLLKERFHILRNNQFLLHGYYNYKYLILGKKDDESEEYWLGVPGIYHEREKMAARMYGFEKFEGAKPRYGIGDLGYYLITAE